MCTGSSETLTQQTCAFRFSNLKLKVGLQLKISKSLVSASEQTYRYSNKHRWLNATLGNNPSVCWECSNAQCESRQTTRYWMGSG
jgi:hypothetical protein